MIGPLNESVHMPVVQSLSLYHSFISEDLQYHQLKSVFLATGKGRRPKLPTLDLTDRLIVQVLRLAEEGAKTFDEAAYFLNKLFPAIAFARLRYLLVSTKAKQTAAADQGLQQIDSSVKLTETLGPFLEGIQRTDILEGQSGLVYKAPCNGLLKDLLTLKRKEGKTFKDVCQWWQNLTGDAISEICMLKAVARFQKKNTSLQPSAHRAKGKEIYDSFLASSPFEIPSSSSSSATASASQCAAIETSSSTRGAPEDSVDEETKKANLVTKLAERAKQLPETQGRRAVTRHQ